MPLDIRYTVCNSLVEFKYYTRILISSTFRCREKIGKALDVTNILAVPTFEDNSYLPVALACLQTIFNVADISGDHEKLVAAVYLQVSILSQALIFVTRSQSWSYFERPGFLLMLAFVGAQMVRLTSKMVTFSSI